MVACSFLLLSAVGSLYSKRVGISVFSILKSKTLEKKKNSTKGSKKQNLNLPHTNNCLLIIYVVLGIISYLQLPTDLGASQWLSGKESACQCRRLEGDAGSIS